MTSWILEEARRDAAADLAERIVRDLGMKKPPINPFRVIRSEKRRLKAIGDDFGDAFDGRLEYGRPRFLLFYNTKYNAWPHDGDNHPRVKFTIAHELGHFFISAHYEYLKRGGEPHGSRSEFVSDNNSEREADAFAGGLLLPGFMFKPLVNTGDLSLDRLEGVARKFETSLLSTIVRAVRLSDRPCAVAGICKGKIAWMFPSNRLIEGGIYPGKESLESPHARAQWQLFLSGNKERHIGHGMVRHWFQLFGKENNLFSACVTEEYLPIQIMSSLVVLLVLDDDALFPEEEEEEDEEDKVHRERFGF